MPPEVGSGSRISDSKTFSRDQVDFFAIFNHFGKVSLFGIKSDQIFLKIFPEAFAEMYEGGPNAASTYRLRVLTQAKSLSITTDADCALA